MAEGWVLGMDFKLAGGRGRKGGVGGRLRISRFVKLRAVEVAKRWLGYGIG